MVARRQHKTMQTAIRTNRLVSTLFPANVRDRVLNGASGERRREEFKEENDEREEMGITSRLVSKLWPANVRDRVKNEAKKKLGSDQDDLVKSFDDGIGIYKTRPIAEFFPQATVMFADIAGFTAWSSTREPFQVFTLVSILAGKATFWAGFCSSSNFLTLPDSSLRLFMGRLM
jgi:hypothetical protein